MAGILEHEVDPISPPKAGHHSCNSRVRQLPQDGDFSDHILLIPELGNFVPRNDLDGELGPLGPPDLWFWPGSRGVVAEDLAGVLDCAEGSMPQVLSEDEVVEFEVREKSRRGGHLSFHPAPFLGPVILRLALLQIGLEALEPGGLCGGGCGLVFRAGSRFPGLVLSEAGEGTLGRGGQVPGAACRSLGASLGPRSGGHGTTDPLLGPRLGGPRGTSEGVAPRRWRPGASPGPRKRRQAPRRSAPCRARGEAHRDRAPRKPYGRWCHGAPGRRHGGPRESAAIVLGDEVFLGLGFRTVAGGVHLLVALLFVHVHAVRAGRRACGLVPIVLVGEQGQGRGRHSAGTPDPACGAGELGRVALLEALEDKRCHAAHRGVPMGLPAADEGGEDRWEDLRQDPRVVAELGKVVVTPHGQDLLAEAPVVAGNAAHNLGQDKGKDSEKISHVHALEQHLELV
mmetsp:Transcript_14816/g.43909  ORF Transcript_14816/g.43909 Transcript_14816/m.43909 type:complete len:455 (+) Transcript_14816:1026-2390(+)